MPVQLQIGFLIVLFVAGLIARRRGWLTPPQAGKMVQLVITVGLPALFLSDVSRIPLHRDLVGAARGGCCRDAANPAGRAAGGALDGSGRPSYGAFVICSMSINNAFLFPFVIAGWGQQAFAQLALFDLGNYVDPGHCDLWRRRDLRGPRDRRAGAAEAHAELPAALGADRRAGH